MRMDRERRRLAWSRMTRKQRAYSCGLLAGAVFWSAVSAGLGLYVTIISGGRRRG